MDLGLGTLDDVKKHVLAASLQSGTTYDTKLATIAKGIAGQCERFCNRKFSRKLNDVFTSPSDRSVITLPRYPIESVSLLEQKFTEQQGWTALDLSLLVQVVNDKGIIQFYVRPGSYLAQLRITYSGGFWYETLEPLDPNFPTPQPAGSTALPAEIKLAWLQQIARVWEVTDKLGTGITQQGGNSTLGLQTSGMTALTPEVKEMLVQFRRYN